MNNKYILGSLIGLATFGNMKGQDTHYSQYADMSAILNPALAGSVYDTRVTGAYRTQWGSVGKAYQTYGVAFEQSIKYKKLKGSHFAVIGSIFRDVAGDAKLSNINPNIGLCYVQTLSRSSKLSAGLQGGFMYKTMDVNALRWDNQFNGYDYDSALPSGEPNTPRSAITAYDAGGGINYSYAQSERFISAKDGNKFNVGVAAFHYQIPKNSFFQSTEKTMTRYIGYVNAEINIPRSKNALLPSAVFILQGPHREFLVGSLFKFILSETSTRTSLRKPTSLAIGGQYRFKDAIIPTILYQYDRYAIGISYDINVSALTPASKRNGGLEVMLRYNTSPGYGKNLGRGDTKASY
jgi:type IX secretion system PorP/SprF family membrane protein